MKSFWTRYTPNYPIALLYLLQVSEYSVGSYLEWYHRTKDFHAVMRRQSLVWTNKIKLLALVMFSISVLTMAIAYLLAPWGLLVVILLPWVLAYGVILPLIIGEAIIQKPKKRKLVESAKKTLAHHKATKIAIAGSFGKTTAKEVLRAVLGEGKKVRATPGNMNTVIGNCRFIQTLEGDEDVLVFELGEAKVGDVRELCDFIQPDIGVITGINEAHLATFGTIENTIKTIFELKDSLNGKPLYKNSESALVRQHTDTKDSLAYSRAGVDGWRVSDKAMSIQGTSFLLKKGKKTIRCNTHLLGEHNIGIIAVAASIASRLGLGVQQIQSGIKETKPFEHRMQPYWVGGACVIDDTYNGNIEGVQAGLKLLKSVAAKRRVYVTPGLVEQGSETKDIHEKIGRLIADSSVDVAVLMRNSVTDHILNGLKSARFSGDVKILNDPLSFYTNMEHYSVNGDVILMQNDWTDNYV